MKIKQLLLIAFISLIAFGLSGCGRDLSTDMYTSDSTLNIAVQGKILSSRLIKIKENEKLGDNSTGAAIGAIGGGAAMGSNTDSVAGIVGGALVGGVVGAVAESALSTTAGVEYIVLVDKSQISADYFAGSSSMRNAVESIKSTGLVTVIQAKEKNAQILPVNQEVLLIISPKRTRVIPKTL